MFFPLLRSSNYQTQDLACLSAGTGAVDIVVDQFVDTLTLSPLNRAWDWLLSISSPWQSPVLSPDTFARNAGLSQGTLELYGKRTALSSSC